MKKFIQKNYIAFTIMEMTLVLLITSIIAAATTPILTSAVSDYADQNYKATAGESSNAPWRPTSSYDGGGIYNSKLENTSPIGIGVKFGASASSYGYPTLAVKTFTSGNFVNSSQIQMGTDIGSEKISMDEFENVALTHSLDACNVGSDNQAYSFPAMFGNNNYMGEKSIYIGSAIQYKPADSTHWEWSLDESTGYYRADQVTSEGKDPENMYYNQSIFLGTYIDTRMNEDSIYIGSFMDRDINERDVIVIGHNMNSEAYAATYEGNILIGNYANVGRVADSIAIGNYSGYSSVFKHDIAIGNYANYNGAFKTSFLVNFGPSSNVSIGQYAGAIFGEKGLIDHGNFSAVNIGGYAGLIRKVDASGVLGHSSGAVNIGDFAGYKEVVYNEINDISGRTRTATINLGYYAGASYYQGEDQTGDGHENSVAIGYYAGRNSFAKNSVIIGSATGTYSNTASSVLIGSGIKEFTYDCRNSYETPECIYPTGTWTAGTAGTDPAYGIVSIGTNAGTNSDYKGIYLGAYAGHWGAGHEYGNVGIGPFTCSHVDGSNKWCLGWGSPSEVSSLNVAKNDMSTTGNITVWNTNVLSKSPQMFIGDARGAIQANDEQRLSYNSNDWNHTAITLYAGHIYRYNTTGTTSSNLTLDQLRWSDKRLKTNISKVYGSLDKIRSVNIYDYTLKNDEHHTPKIGVIAQEFKKIFPYEVKVEPNSKNYAVGTGSLLYTMLDAIKDLDINIQHLQTSFDNYVKDFFGLKSKVAKLEAQSKKLQADNAQMKSRLAKINAKLK